MFLASVTSRIDYCYSLLAGFLAPWLAALELVGLSSAFGSHFSPTSTYMRYVLH